MREKVTLFLMISIFFALPALAATFGDGIRVDKTTLVSELLENGDKYIGQRVQVHGMIVDVCESRGCWVYVSGDRPFEKIRVKVKDGEIVFPLEARGQQARIEGVLEKFDLSRDEVIARKRHHAEERGESFDPASVTKGETFFQIRGLGAEIEGL